jgi:hypothetical protein
MSDTTISGLPQTNAIDGTAVLPTDYSGTTYKVTANTLGSWITNNATTVSATGNITAANFIGNISITGNVTGTSPNVTLVAGSYTYTFDNTGNVTLPTGGDLIFSANTTMTSVSNGNITIDPNGTGQLIVTSTTPAQFGNTISATGNITTSGRFVGDGSALSNVATQTTGSWTLAPGTNTVSLSVPINGVYSIWVRGNIPNGIVTYTATVVVTNTNVPVLGTSYGWYYAAGNALVLTAIPAQIVGTLNNISSAVVSTTTANVFTFGITNNSGTSQVVSYGYTELG